MATITADEAGSSHVPTFLDLLAYSEGTNTEPATQNDGYDVIVTGEDEMGGKVHEEVFTDYSIHPFCVTPPRPPMIVREGPPELESTASGRYQLLARYYPIYKTQLGLPDFSPLSQDKVAIQQLRECRALPMIEAGNISGAIQAAASRWASLPGSTAGQGGKSLAVLLAKWDMLVAAG